jgi:hypothetical protein
MQIGIFVALQVSKSTDSTEAMPPITRFNLQPGCGSYGGFPPPLPQPFRELIANTDTVQTLTSSEHRKNLLIPRVLLTAISAVVAGMGLLAILTQHYYGVSTRHGYHELNLDGDKAMASALSSPSSWAGHSRLTC